jgi:hypothetical protein
MLLVLQLVYGDGMVVKECIGRRDLGGSRPVNGADLSVIG